MYFPEAGDNGRTQVIPRNDMKKLISNIYILFLMRIILSLVFIFAGIEKIISPAGFSESISNYRLLPSTIIIFSAITLPWVELFTGILLLFGISVKENAAIITALLVVFTLAVIISILRGLSIDCGCFGTALGERVGMLKVTENVLLILFGMVLARTDSDYLKL
jgi:uncharacterized membrane protein YphA (DoxX/SURF4 family)